MKKDIRTLAALLIASATFVACSSDDNIANETQQPVNPTGKYTMTINASKGGGATTRALSLDGKTLNVKWAATDQVSVFPEAWSATLTLEPMGALTAAASDNGSTTLTGTLTTLPAVNDKLNLLFPRAEWDYTGQTGVLLSDDNSIEKKFDYAMAQVTVATAEGDKITADGDADFTSQQAIVKFTLKDNGNAISASSLKIAAAGGKLVQSRGMKKTYYPEGWEPVSGVGKYYVYVETNTTIQTQNSVLMSDRGQFALDATYGTNGCKKIDGKYLYRFVCEVEDAPTRIDDVYIYFDNNTYLIGGNISFTNGMYLNAASNFSTVSTGEGDPVMGATYGPLTITPASATGELTVALRNELGAADSYSFEATDGEGNKYIFSRPNVNFENGKYYEIAMSMEKVAADKYVDLSTKTGDYTAQDGDVLTGQLPSQYRVTIAAGATVTLFNATINTSSWYPAIECTGNATIVLKGSNVISASSEQGSAIKPYYEEGSTLTIQGNGSLTATGKVGIGFGPWDSGRGNLTIAGGNITAIGKGGAGIGSGESGYFYGNITISGGTVNATGSNGAAGIGSGAENASCGNILISGGTVNATGGNYAPGIGAGNHGSSCGTITITNDVTSVTATKGSDAYNSIGKGNSGWGTCGTITIGGTVYPDGITDSPFVYPIPAPAATGHALSASVVGEIVCSDGLAYAAADKDNLPTGVTAVAIVAYLGDGDTSDNTYNNGLAIAMSDANDGSGCGWGDYFVSYNCVSKSNDIATAIGYKDGISSTNTLTSDGHYHEAATAAVSNNGTAAPTGTSGWFLPSIGQWNLIVQGLASKKAGSAVTTDITKFDENDTYKASNLNSVITDAGGTGFNGGYQSSTQYDSDDCWHMDISEGRASNYVFYAGDYVRSVLAF